MSLSLISSIRTTLISSLLLSCQWSFPILNQSFSLFLLTAKQEQSADSRSSQVSSPVASPCSQQNQQRQGNVTFIGRIPGSPYVVIVPVQRSNTLTIVRQCIVDAFQTDSRLGAYVQAGVFSNRYQAENLVRHLRTLDLDARLIYRP